MAASILRHAGWISVTIPLPVLKPVLTRTLALPIQGQDY